MNQNRIIWSHPSNCISGRQQKRRKQWYIILTSAVMISANHNIPKQWNNHVNRYHHHHQHHHQHDRGPFQSRHLRYTNDANDNDDKKKDKKEADISEEEVEETSESKENIKSPTENNNNNNQATINTNSTGGTIHSPEDKSKIRTHWYNFNIEKDSILYDVIRGFFFAAIITCWITCIYHCCYCCFIRCGCCPDDHFVSSLRRRRQQRRRRRRKRQLLRNRNDDGLRYNDDWNNDDNDDWDENRGMFVPLQTHPPTEDDYDYDDDDDDDQSNLSEEYGDQQLEDEYGETHRRFTDSDVRVAAKQYFDTQEKRERSKQTTSNKQSKRFFGLPFILKQQQKQKKQSKTDSNINHPKEEVDDDDDYRLQRIVGDGKDDDPLDLEMIERKILESMKDTNNDDTDFSLEEDG